MDIVNGQTKDAECDSNIEEQIKPECHETSENLMKLEDKTNHCEDILQSLTSSGEAYVAQISEETYASKLFEEMDLARKNGSFCDVTLLIGPEKHPIKAHKVFLSLDSDYFKAMFRTELKEGSQSEIELPAIDVATMESIMEFTYTGKINVTNENIEKITKAANFFSMSKLLGNCIAHIEGRINSTNCIEILEFSDQISNIKLKDCAKEYFIQNFDEVSSTNLDIMNMTTSLFLEIIGEDKTSIHGDPSLNEEKLFQIGWTNLHMRSNNKYNILLPKLLKLVRLPLLNTRSLHALLKKVEDNKEAKLLVEKALNIKSTMSNNKEKTESSEPIESLSWCKDRSIKSGKVSTESLEWTFYSGSEGDCHFRSESITLKGKEWCMNVQLDVASISLSVKANVQCISDLQSSQVPCKYQFEIEGGKSERKFYKSENIQHTFTAKSRVSDWTKIAFLYFEEGTDCFGRTRKVTSESNCTVIANITVL